MAGRKFSEVSPPPQFHHFVAQMLNVLTPPTFERNRRATQVRRQATSALLTTDLRPLSPFSTSLLPIFYLPECLRTLDVFRNRRLCRDASISSAWLLVAGRSLENLISSHSATFACCCSWLIILDPIFIFALQCPRPLQSLTAMSHAHQGLLDEAKGLLNERTCRVLLVSGPCSSPPFSESFRRINFPRHGRWQRQSRLQTTRSTTKTD